MFNFFEYYTDKRIDKILAIPELNTLFTEYHNLEKEITNFINTKLIPHERVISQYRDLLPKATNKEREEYSDIIEYAKSELEINNKKYESLRSKYLDIRAAIIKEAEKLSKKDCKFIKETII